MSLINNMLKDLEQRQVAQTCTPHGVLEDLVPAMHTPRRKTGIPPLLGIGLVIAVLAGISLAMWPQAPAVRDTEMIPALTASSTQKNSTTHSASPDVISRQIIPPADQHAVERIESAQPVRVTDTNLQETADRMRLTITLSRPLAQTPVLRIEQGKARIELAGLDIGQKLALPENTASYYKNIRIQQTLDATAISFSVDDGSHTDVSVVDGNGAQKILIDYRPAPAAGMTSTRNTHVPVAPAPVARKEPVPAKEPVAVMRKTIVSSPRERAASEYRSGTAALQKGNPYLAEKKFRTALKLDPGYTTATQALAALLINDQRTAEAEDCLRSALQHSPGEPAFTSLYAHILIQRNEIQNAVQILESGLNHAERNADYLALLGTAYQRLALYPQAIQYYETALKLRRDQGSWWAGLAVSLEGNGQAVPALTAYQNALRAPVLNQTLKKYALERIDALRKANP